MKIGKQFELYRTSYGWHVHILRLCVSIRRRND